MRFPFRPIPTIALLAVLFALASGCSRTPPLHIVVKADNRASFNLWKAGEANRFSPQEWKDFNTAVAELKLGIMLSGAASGHEAIDQATLGKINGMTVREVLVLGLGSKLDRLRAERDKLEGFIKGNRTLTTKEGDLESAHYLEGLNNRQTRRLDGINTHIEETVAILKRRGLPLPSS